MSTKANHTVCGHNDFRRPRYFHGMLLDDRDFIAEQDYHAAKRRLLNRTLHGAGVVCGLGLKIKCGLTLEVSPGLALDGCGQEIWLKEPFLLDLGKLLPPQAPPRGKQLCADQDAKDPAPPPPYYLGIRYQEKGAEPESVYLPGAGCEERTCEYSRWKEGFCFELVECCQGGAKAGLLKELCAPTAGCGSDAKAEPGSVQGCWACDGLEGPAHARCLRLQEFCDRAVPCPDGCGGCGCAGHVVLGSIELDENRCLRKVCVNDCREYVLTGPLLKHLLVDTLAGLDKDILSLRLNEEDRPLPDIPSLVANPVKALCWFLRYLLIEKGELRVTGCKDLFGSEADHDQTLAREEWAARMKAYEKDQAKLTKDLNALTKTAQSLASTDELQTLRKEFLALREENKTLLEQLSKLQAGLKKA